MPTKKGSSTGSKKGVSTPSTDYIQGQAKSGNPTPTSDPPSKQKSKGKPAKMNKK